MSSVPDTAIAFPARSWADKLRTYLEITRPRVMALVVFTGLPALGLGTIWPTWTTAFWILLGTAMAGGASSALNAYFERETDARMARTRNRPLPAAILLPHVVLAYGLVLAVLGTLVLGIVGGWLAAVVGVATMVFYVGIYTIWLKPRTPQNIVIGGAAGGTAPLIASAAMNGHISIGAWILFAIIFLWTPPHFWAVAIYRKKEYASAGFPMMPLVVGDQPTRWRSLIYAVMLIPVTLLPVYLGYLSALYAVAGAVLGIWFAGLVVRSIMRQEPAADWRVFKGSLIYLASLFAAMLVDLMIPWQ